MIPGMFAGGAMGQGGGGGTFGTFDPSNKYATINLSSSDMVATATEGGGFRTAYGQPAKVHDSISYAVEYEVLAIDAFLGFAANGSSTNPSDPGGGASFGRFAAYSASGYVFNPSFNGGFATYTVGDRIGAKAEPTGGNWTITLYKNGTSITTAVLNGTLDMVPCFITYFDADASARLITDPSDMSYWGSYGADEGWPA